MRLMNKFKLSNLFSKQIIKAISMRLISKFKTLSMELRELETHFYFLREFNFIINLILSKVREKRLL